MDFPGIDSFEPNAALSHAIFALRGAIPANCDSLKVEFDEMGAALVTGNMPGGETCDLVLSGDQMGAAGLLLTYTSYQVIALSRMLASRGEDAVDAAQRRLARSLAVVRLRAGLLSETLDDSIVVSR